MKVALYLRISTEGEDDRSLDNHEADLRAWAADEGWVVVESYRERKSGKLWSERPVLTAVVKAAVAGEFGGLLVWHVDRFGRGLDSARAWLDLRQAKVDVYDLDRRGPLTEVEFAEGLARAISERERITARTRRGRRAQAENGRWPGGPFPFGVVGKDGVLVEDKSEADEVRRMAQAILTGRTPNQLGADLDARGVRSSSRGGHWSGNRVRRLLRQPRLSQGHMGYWDVRLPHPVILDPGDHQRVLDRLDVTRDRFSPRTGPNPYPLTGRITDPAGHHWIGFPRHKNGEVVRHYRCSRYYLKPTCEWRTARIIQADEVEDAVWEQLMYVLGGGSADDRPPGVHQFAHLHEAIVNELSKVEAPSDQAIKDKAKEVSRLEDALADADAETRMADDRARVARAAKKLEQRLAKARQALRDLEALKAAAAEERSIWDAVEEAAQRVTALRDETDPKARGKVFAELDITVKLDEPVAWGGYDEGRYGIRLNGRLGEVPWESLLEGGVR